VPGSAIKASSREVPEPPITPSLAIGTPRVRTGSQV
jgi:hypothetical protein